MTQEECKQECIRISTKYHIPLLFDGYDNWGEMMIDLIQWEKERNETNGI